MHKNYKQTNHLYFNVHIQYIIKVFLFKQCLHKYRKYKTTFSQPIDGCKRCLSLNRNPIPFFLHFYKQSIFFFRLLASWGCQPECCQSPGHRNSVCHLWRPSNRKTLWSLQLWWLQGFLQTQRSQKPHVLVQVGNRLLLHVLQITFS